MHATDWEESDKDPRARVNFNKRAHVNQQKLADVKPPYDFIVCGSGSSGSVVARLTPCLESMIAPPYQDMVDLRYRLLTEKLGITHLHRCLACQWEA
jgi:hypothetical protein